MCCFSSQVQIVSNTNIFARFGSPGRQYLVYSMTLAAEQELAMILPLPTPPNPAEDAVRFINLEDFAAFFSEMDNGFETYVLSLGAAPATKTRAVLQVHDVGSFEASFVPAVSDFSRLDPRFQLPPNTWKKLPLYRDYAFAVFKLKITADSGGGQPKPYHPMAFEFPTRNPDAIFFPTVHIHDGEVHETAMFDHSLYCQGPVRTESPRPPPPQKPGFFARLLGPKPAPPAPRVRRLDPWENSGRAAAAYMNIEKTLGIVDGQKACYRRTLRGDLPNADTWLPLDKNPAMKSAAV